MKHNPETPPVPAAMAPTRIVRNAILTANFLSSFAIGVAAGGIVPFLSLIMERRGVDAVVIGANTATGSLGIIVMAAFAPTIIRLLGFGNAILGGLAISAIAMLLMGLVDSMIAWFPLRFLCVGCLGIHWVISETWMNAVATSRDRGRIMSIYVTIIAAGFAAGPVILDQIGLEGLLPFALFAGFTLLSAAPLALVVRYAPRMHDSAIGSPAMLARTAPTIFAAVVLTGASTGICFAFLTIYGVRSGMSESEAVYLLSAFLAGNLLFQIPLGWLAERINHRLLLVACAGIAITAPPLLPGLLSTTVPLALLVALWGGALFGLYTIGIIMLGSRFHGSRLVVANAAFVVSFESAGMIGPPAAGLLISLWMLDGMLVLLTAVAAVFSVFILGRGLRQRRRAGKSGTS